MRNLLVVLVGFLVGGVAMLAVVIALPRMASAPRPAQTAQAMGATMPAGMMNVSATRSATRMSGAQPLKLLTIQHVERGCHVWSNGKMTATMVRLHLKTGQKLAIVDLDVDAHQMMQFAGPAHLRMGGPMTMNHDLTMTFAKKGVYRLGTETVETPGAMDVKTAGPDNNLRLVVTVA